MDDLKNKLEPIIDKHFEEVQDARIAAFDQAFIYEAFEFRGGFKAISSVTRTLSSKLIMGLMMIEEKKYWKVWKFKSFADYLSSDEVSEFSKSKYYDLKKLFISEGPEVFDVFSGKRIPLSTRKLLAARGVEINVEGDDLVIDGDQRIPISDSAAVVELVEAVHHALSERDAREDKLAKDNEKLKKENEVGKSEFNELRRSFDALNEDSPFKKAISKFFAASIGLVDEIKKLPEGERLERGEDDIRLFTQQWFLIRDAYGIKIGLSDDTIDQMDLRKNMKPVEEMSDEEKKATFLDRAIATVDAEEGFDID